MTITVHDNLIKLLTKYNEYEAKLNLLDYKSDQVQITHIKRMLKRSVDYVTLFRKYQKFAKEKKKLTKQKQIETDHDFRELIDSEIKQLKIETDSVELQINELLLINQKYDNSIIIMEIRGAVGGDEANIFANDLYMMYVNYIEKMNWRSKIINLDGESSQSLTTVQFEISGKDVYNKLQFEAGIHRVQRVPMTEVRGRTHTSTVSVAILKKPKKIHFSIDASDIRTDRFRASAAGGQHVNKTDSAIRITHFPTGIVTTSQDGRSQHENRKTAMDLLTLKIYEKMEQENINKMQKQRNTAIKHGERAEKIRTYNYAQNRVTDHRINVSWKNLDKIILGSLDKIINALTINFQAEQIKNIYEQF